MPTPDVPEEFLSQVGDFRQILDALQRLPGALFAIKNLESKENKEVSKRFPTGLAPLQ